MNGRHICQKRVFRASVFWPARFGRRDPEGGAGNEIRRGTV